MTTEAGPQQARTLPSECVRCGACSAVCPVFRAEPRESLTARGRMHLLGALDTAKPGPHLQDLLARCLLCGACQDTCPRDIPILDLTVAARARCGALAGDHGVRKWLARAALARPLLLQGLLRAGHSLQGLRLLPLDSGLRLRLGLLESPAAVPEQTLLPSLPAEKQPRIRYFSGCLAAHLQPSIAQASERIMALVHETAVDRPAGQGCCGLAALAAGRRGQAIRLAKRNLQAFAGEGPIVCSCASCFSHLRSYTTLLAGEPDWQRQAEAFCARLVEFSDCILQGLSGRSLPATTATRLVHYHQPCHLRFGQGQDQTKALLDRCGSLRQGSGTVQCCGHGGLFQLSYPQLSASIFASCAGEALGDNPDLVTTTCSGCLLQWQMGMAGQLHPPRVAHLAIVLLECMK